MRFGTYFFLQAPPGHRHADIIERELRQMVWSEQLGFDEVWLTEHHFIDYGLSVDPATAEVTVVEADLHGVPAEIAAAVDTVARSAEGGAALDGLLLTSVRWHAPPDEGTFALAYRSGDEEESCSMDVELDIETVTVTEVDSSGC